MPMPKDELQHEYAGSWRTYVNSLEQAVQKLEADIREASEMADACTSEWCQATEHVVDDLSNALFSISEPRWANAEDSAKIKTLKRRVHDLYADYRAASRGGNVNTNR
jgi:capsid protein